MGPVNQLITRGHQLGGFSQVVLPWAACAEWSDEATKRSPISPSKKDESRKWNEVKTIFPPYFTSKKPCVFGETWGFYHGPIMGCSNRWRRHVPNGNDVSKLSGGEPDVTCCLNLRVRLDVSPRKRASMGSQWFGLWLPLFLSMVFLVKNMGNGTDRSAIIGSQYNVPRFVVWESMAKPLQVLYLQRRERWLETADGLLFKANSHVLYDVIGIICIN